MGVREEGVVSTGKERNREMGLEKNTYNADSANHDLLNIFIVTATGARTRKREYREN